MLTYVVPTKPTKLLQMSRGRTRVSSTLFQLTSAFFCFSSLSIYIYIIFRELKLTAPESVTSSKKHDHQRVEFKLWTKVPLRCGVTWGQNGTNGTTMHSCQDTLTCRPRAMFRALLQSFLQSLLRLGKHERSMKHS